jgi:putative secretion ATPase (PEP-CTERM system associated)
MYTEYFGLVAKPFELVPNPLFLFNSHSHKKAINYLQYGLQERAGFIMLAGEVGSGKTTIIRDIISNLSADIALSQVFNTSSNARQIIAMINEDFGLAVDGKDKVSLLRDLNDHLVALHTAGKRAVIIIDEAQNLSPAVLEEVRQLSNIEAKNAKLVQIVLVGQPELQEILTQPELRQLRQRISVHCQLEPLTRRETEDYVYHRLTMAGNRNALVWQAGCFDVIYKYSEGCPRMINVFCDFALLCAFVEQTRNVTIEMVNEIIGDISWQRPVEKALLVAATVSEAQSANDTSALSQRLLALEQRLDNLIDQGTSAGALEQILARQEQLLHQLVDQQAASAKLLDKSLRQIASQLGRR